MDKCDSLGRYFPSNIMKHFGGSNVFIYERKSACRRKEHEDHEHFKTTAHLGRPEKPFPGRTRGTARAAQYWRAFPPRSATPGILRDLRRRPRLLHLQIPEREQGAAARRVGARPCCRNGGLFLPGRVTPLGAPYDLSSSRFKATELMQ